MEERKNSYFFSIILTPKPGNLRFSELRVQGTGLDVSTFSKFLDGVNDLKDDVEAKIMITIETK